MKYIIIIISALFLVGASAYGGFNYLLNKAMAIPSNSPLQCQTKSADHKNIMVALGDSITHAKVSADYLQMLTETANDPKYSYINAGINSRLAYNALQVVDSVIACDPSVVTILIGTNDVLATRSEKVAQRYVNQWQLPQTPDLIFYQNSLTKIIEQLQQRTNAKIAILSLPPIGERINSVMNNTIATYNRFIKATAAKHHITYLPLNERMWQSLNLQGDNNKACPFTDKLMEKAIAKHYIFNDSWNKISADNDLKLLTDCIHLNENGAKIVADLIKNYLANQTTS